VSPKLDHITLCLDSLRRGLGYSLEDLGHVSQVIGVMRIGRSRSELHLDHLVNGNGVIHNIVSHSLDTT
jgi:hypothetical protein